MATTYYIGPHMNEVPQITAADTVRLRLLLTDASSPLVGKTGIAWDAAGMTVGYCKPGESSFTTFPTFDTNNWDELGYGWYDLILRGSDAGELALLDTVGAILFYVKATATNETHLARKIVPADAVREDVWTDAKAGFIDASIAGREASGAAAAAVGALHDFDPSAEEVDIGAVKGAAVTDVDDFKADVSGLALTGEAASAVGTLNDLAAQDVRDAMKLAPTAGDPAAGSVDIHLDNIEEDTGTTIPALEPLGTPMRGTESAALASAWTAELAALLNTLAGHDPGGTLASSAEVTAIQNNTRCVRVVPSVIERPDSGSTAYRIELLLYDETGNMEAPDAAPTIGVVNQAGTSRDANLDATTMTLVSTGRYRSTYTVASDHAIEQLVVAFSVVEGGNTRLFANPAQVVDTTAVDFTAADRTKLDALHDTRLTAARALLLDKLDVTGTLAHSDAAATYKADVSALALEATVDAVASAIAALNDLSGAEVTAAVPTVAQIADAVLDELMAGHATAGSAAEFLRMVKEALYHKRTVNKATGAEVQYQEDNTTQRETFSNTEVGDVLMRTPT